MGEETRLVRVAFEYEDGKVIVYDETEDHVIGKTFFKTLTGFDLKPRIVKRSSSPHLIVSKIRSFFKI